MWRFLVSGSDNEAWPTLEDIPTQISAQERCFVIVDICQDCLSNWNSLNTMLSIFVHWFIVMLISSYVWCFGVGGGHRAALLDSSSWNKYGRSRSHHWGEGLPFRKWSSEFKVETDSFKSVFTKISTGYGVPDYLQTIETRPCMANQELFGDQGLQWSFAPAFLHIWRFSRENFMKFLDRRRACHYNGSLSRACNWEPLGKS